MKILPKKINYDVINEWLENPAVDDFFKRKQDILNFITNEIWNCQRGCRRGFMCGIEYEKHLNLLLDRFYVMEDSFNEKESA